MGKRMCFMVWRDMRMQIRNYQWFRRQENGASGIWVIIYLFGFLPVWCGIFETPGRAVTYFMTVISLLMAMLLGKICPMSLPLMMYLCPMKAQERRKYLVTAYLAKVFCATFISVISGVILFRFGLISWYVAVLLIFAVVMAALGRNMAGAERAFQSSSQRDMALKERCHGYFGWMTAQQIYSIFYFIVVFSGMATGQDQGSISSVEVWLLVIFSGIYLLLTLLVLSYFKGTLEVMMNYEVVGRTEKAGRAKR